MEWNISDIEDDLIDQLTKHELGQFWIASESKNEDGCTLRVEIDGWIDEEDRDVSISDCEIFANDKDDDELPTDGIKVNTARIEKEASDEISRDIQDARDTEETERYLSWGGWFV